MQCIHRGSAGCQVMIHKILNLTTNTRTCIQLGMNELLVIMIMIVIIIKLYVLFLVEYIVVSASECDSISSVISMAQYGLLDKWKEKYFLKSKCGEGKQYNSGPILFSHIWLLLAVTAGCLGVCVVVFYLELFMSLVTRLAYTK